MYFNTLQKNFEKTIKNYFSSLVIWVKENKKMTALLIFLFILILIASFFCYYLLSELETARLLAQNNDALLKAKIKALELKLNKQIVMDTKLKKDMLDIKSHDDISFLLSTIFVWGAAFFSICFISKNIAYTEKITNDCLLNNENTIAWLHQLYDVAFVHSGNKVILIYIAEFIKQLGGQ